MPWTCLRKRKALKPEKAISRLWMHRILEEIINSAEIRAESLEFQPLRVHARSIRESIENARRRGEIPIISEVKPASPTRTFRDLTPSDAADIAGVMERAGACGISVLTEPDHFHGSIENLKAVRESVSLPVLRKDFIVRETQIVESEADMMLLIAGVLSERLAEFIGLVEDLGAEPLVEVHTQAEAERVLAGDADLIGINNRDLETMEVDLRVTETLAPMIRRERPDAVIIAESGVRTPADVLRMIESSADAVLVGGAIMEGEIYKNTERLVHAGDAE